MSKRYKNRGFTLLELMIVITILLSLTFLVTIKKHDESILLENTANEIVSAIRYARHSYDSGNNSVWGLLKREKEQYYFQVIERNKTMINIPIDSSIRLLKKYTDDAESENNTNGFNELGATPLEIKFSGDSTTGISLLLYNASVSTQYKITIVPTSSRVHVHKITRQR